MSTRWVFGTDGSVESRAALSWALDHAPGHDARLAVVHAHHEPLAGRVAARLRGDAAADGVSATQVLRELDPAMAEQIGDGSTIEHRIVAGHPGQALVGIAGDADLLIVGHRGAGRSWRHGLGSVSRFCVSHSPVPTVVVPADWDRRPTRRVVAGFDGSDNATSALHWTLDFADPDIEITAVIALEVAPWLSAEIIEVHLEQELQAEEHRLRALIDAADPTGRAKRHVVVRGARPALARAAETTDLMVLGAHGSGRLATSLMGSVSSWMLDAAACPIAVIPHPQADPPTERT